MARKELDLTGNEPAGVAMGKIQENFVELYDAVDGTATTTWSGSTVTASGLISGGSLQLDTGTKTASATAGAATLNKDAGVITSEALTTAAGSEYTLTITNSSIAAADQVFVALQNGTNTTYPIHVTTVTPGSGSVVVKVLNANGSAAALNGTIKVAFMVLKN